MAANLFTTILKEMQHAAEWIAEHLGDPKLAQALREDLGLAAGADIPVGDQAKFRQLASKIDPDAASFEETLQAVLEIADAIRVLAASLDDGASGRTTWDIMYLLGTIAVAQNMRARSALVYTLARLTLFVSDDPEAIEQFDPALLMQLLRGDTSGAGQRLAARLSHSLSLIPTALDIALQHFERDDWVDYFYGWDPPRGSSTQHADQVSARTLTMLVGPSSEDASERAMISMTGVPSDGGMAALAMSIGGALQQKLANDDGWDIDLTVGGGGALAVRIPFDGSAFAARTAAELFAELEVTRDGEEGKPAYTLTSADHTRIEIGRYGGKLEIDREAVSVVARVKDAALVVTPGQADGFLKNVLGGDLRVAFDLGVKLHSEHGFTLEGGSGVRATIPIEKTVLNALKVHHLTVALGPSTTGRAATVEVSGSFGLQLGPFQAAIDRLGFSLDVAVRDGNLGFLDLAIGFKPPNGIGLLLDAAVVRGGGYIYLDPAAGEYAGTLDLAIKVPAFSVSIKAIGVLSTKLPDGGDGWALLLLVYGQFPPIQLGFGFTLTGIGGMIGLQHGVSVDALVAGMKTGALDDILFPSNPVADAPRIIARLRTVFPITPRALVLGPMVEIGWGTPNIVQLRMGVIVQIDDILGKGTEPISFGRVVILGQLRVMLPPGVSKDMQIVHLLVDFIGAIELDPFRIGFAARLRDSSIGVANFRIDIGGMMVLQAVFGGKPSFVIAAGGFHPDFRDVPPGLPAPIERLSAAFPVGIAKLRIEAYFATTPASVQAGASVSLKIRAGPVDVEAGIGFDAICYFKPAFRFDVKIYGSAAIKFKGRRLAGISFEFRLEGPGRWRARGYGSFSILWWDIDVPFDESWGESPQIEEQSTDASALLAAALATPGNWSAQLPIGGEPLVTLAKIEGESRVLAHPLGTLTFAQRVLPFDLQLEKIGTTSVAGASRFTIAGGYLGANQSSRPATPHAEAFAVGEFRHLSDAQKLNEPGFQPFTAGARFGDTSYSAGAPAPDQGMEHEVHYLEPERKRFHAIPDRMLNTVTLGQATRFARAGAAAKSKLRQDRRLHAVNSVRIDVGDPPVAAASTTTMKQQATAFGAVATRAPMLVQDQIARSGLAAVQAVEAFELVWEGER